VRLFVVVLTEVFRS